MARKKTESIENNANEIIPEEQVWTTLDFAQQLGGLYPGVYSPQLVSQRMKDMNLLTVGEITQERAEKALANPKDSEKELLAISEGLEYTSTSYRRIIDYLSNLPSWDFTYAAINVDNPEEFKSPAYKKDLKILKEFFYHFNHRQEFSQILKQLLREESVYCSYRDEGELVNSKFVMQQLPSDRCMITGRWEGGMLFSFDYTFFLQGGVDINMFAPAFKTGFLELFGQDGKIIDYIPSRSIDTRSQNQFAYFKDCSPEDGFWCFKFQPAVAQSINMIYYIFHISKILSF